MRTLLDKTALFQLTATALIAASTPLMAAPSISEVALQSDTDLKITGSGFGEGPKVALYDNFENAERRDGKTTFNPQIGNYYRKDANSPVVTTSRGGVNSNSVFARHAEKTYETRLFFGVEDNNGVHGLKHFQEVYFAYTIKDAGDFPGPNGGPKNFSDVSATKDAWMMFGSRGDNTALVAPSPQGHDLYIPGWTGKSFTISGNETRTSPGYWQHSLKDNWVFGGWVTKMFHAELNPDDPYGDATGFFSFLNKEKYELNERNGNFMSDQSDEGVPYPYWDRVKFFAWMNPGDADVQRVVDEIYVAIGENANARVVLTDAKRLSDSTVIFHLPPESWENDTITAPLPDIDMDREYYLHVSDAQNNFSTSKLLCMECPNPPKPVTVQ